MSPELAQLPRRIPTLVDLAIPSTVVADIGYDHGQVLERIAARCPSTRLIGVERISTAADKLAARLPSHRALELYEGDGFAPIRDTSIDTAVLAGMGEATVLKILYGHSELKNRVRRLLIGIPRSSALTRVALNQLGYGLREERLAREGDRIYELSLYDRDVTPTQDLVEVLYGQALLRHPLARPYLDTLRRREGKILGADGPFSPSAEGMPPVAPSEAGRFFRIKIRALDDAYVRVSKFEGEAGSFQVKSL